MKKFYFLFLFALIASVSNLWAAEVTDVITASNLKATGTTYTDFSNVTITSNAAYSGISAKNNAGAIQLRTKNSDSGIVSVKSGGTIKSVTITVSSGSGTIDVYGNNTAYTSAKNLYATGVSNQGTKVGSLSKTGTITFTDNYSYIGIRSNSGAVYISKIEITYEVELPKCAAPTFSLADGGYYRGEQTLKMESATEGALIHYEIKRNGAQWGESSYYKGETPQTVTLSDQGVYTVTAYAYPSDESMEDSDTNTITFTISDKCATPTFNLENNATYTDEQTLIIYSATPNTVVNYLVKRNGDESYAYATDVDAHDPIKIPIGLTGNYTVTAVAYINELDPAFEESEKATLAFTIEKKCEAPKFSLANDGEYTDFQTLTISSATEGAIIEYTIEGDKTGSVSSLGNSPVSIPLNANDTYMVTAKATKANYDDSAEESIMFTINKTCDAPTFDLTPGTYTTAKTVTITGPEGSTITYTLNDDVQEEASPATVELPLVEGEVTTYTLKAVASLAGTNDSQEVTAVYVINPNHEDKTATFVVADYATANNWVSGDKYTEVTVDGLTFTASGSSNTGKYYNSKNIKTWRIYPSENATLTITAPAKHVLYSVKFTNAQGNFQVADKGELNGSEWSSAGYDVVEVVFSFSSTDATHVRIQNIDIEYAFDPVSSVSKVSAEDGVKVVAAEGGVEVVAAEAADVAVYTVAGQLVRAQRVAEGSTLVNVPAGFYVVRAAGTVAKVVVK